jgi:NADPH:quinone reductase-like Zn-dependent oxidoreductase
MFTRSTFMTDDMTEQHRILDRMAELVDAGRIRTTLTRTLTGFTAANHRQAHQIVEASQMIGKLAIAYS